METLGILVLVSLSLSLPGVFLVLRKMCMTADAMSHTVLLGIVLAFLIIHDIDSPLLTIAAALAGLFTVLAIEGLIQGNKLRKDAAIGVVYSFLFAVAVLLITKFARNSHLSVEMILMGEVLYASLRRITFLGINMPKAVLDMLVLFILNAGFISLFYKELKLTSFDETYSKVSGFGNPLLNLGLMALVSLSCVVAFDSVGSILVLAFFTCPVVCAFLIARNLKEMFLYSAIFAALMSSLGYFIAVFYNVSLAGMCATCGGILVLIVALCGPKGIIVHNLQRKRLAREQKMLSLLDHIGNHQKSSDEIKELRLITMHAHLDWDEDEVLEYLRMLEKRGLVERSLNDYGCPFLTEKGKKLYQSRLN